MPLPQGVLPQRELAGTRVVPLLKSFQLYVCKPTEGQPRTRKSLYARPGTFLKSRSVGGFMPRQMISDQINLLACLWFS